MTFNEFFSQLSSIGAEQIDFWGVVLANGRIVAIRQMSFKLPVLEKMVVASVGCVKMANIFNSRRP